MLETPRLTVLMSFPAPRPTSVNPYTHQLAASIRLRDVEVLTFSWLTALTARFDVFHVHWPEILVDGRTPIRRLVRRALTLALVVRLAVLKRPIVRTAHNLAAPEGLTRVQRALLQLIERRTALTILLNEHTPVPSRARSVMAPHPHFREWFASYEPSAPVRGQLGYVGRIRRYKGVESLIAAVNAAPSEVSARIAGYPSSVELAQSMRRSASADPRIALTLGFISDEMLVDVVTSSELVVLPYRVMHNSAAALTALSLDRPVLVPRNEVTVDLAREVGDGWVHTYTGELDSPQLQHALRATRDPRTPPRLDARSWESSARVHVAAYRQAVAAARGVRS